MNKADKLGKKRVTSSECDELTDKTVFINRVAKVVKGGRRFSFSALIVTGDGRGHVGFGSGKAAEVPEAIRKGSEGAHKNLVKVPLKGTTIPHEVMGKFGACRVLLKPAAPGTGVIAGSVVRAIVESAGIADIRTKCIGSSNPHNVLQAVFAGLMSLREVNSTAMLRNIAPEDLGYVNY
jgi:small subunit ribosomal protein S5